MTGPDGLSGLGDGVTGSDTAADNVAGTGPTPVRRTAGDIATAATACCRFFLVNTFGIVENYLSTCSVDLGPTRRSGGPGPNATGNPLIRPPPCHT